MRYPPHKTVKYLYKKLCLGPADVPFRLSYKESTGAPARSVWHTGIPGSAVLSIQEHFGSASQVCGPVPLWLRASHAAHCVVHTKSGIPQLALEQCLLPG